jgi:prepilin signal peptidase PulO-like enzyme (type II secretory pathway)
MPDIEYLKMIQGVIGRLAGNSFLVKGWSVTISAGLSAFARSETDRSLAWIGVGVVVVFAVLDAYFLAGERGYRKLYEEAVDAPAGSYAMSAGTVSLRAVGSALISISVLPLHAAVAAGATVVALST